MKKGLTYLLPAFGITIFLMSGCKGNSRQMECIESDDSLVVQQVPDTALYGHLGEGTGMSCLELITDDGDTLVLNKTDEDSGEDALILGEIANYTDRFSIITYHDDQSVKIALNMNMLERKWQSGTDEKNGFSLDANGHVGMLTEGQGDYDKWSLCNCQLIMLRENERMDGVETRNDTLDILQLTTDSLVLRRIHDGHVETFYHIM